MYSCDEVDNWKIAARLFQRNKNFVNWFYKETFNHGNSRRNGIPFCFSASGSFHSYIKN